MEPLCNRGWPPRFNPTRPGDPAPASEQGDKLTTSSQRSASQASVGELRDALVAFSDEVFESMQRLLRAQHDLTKVILGSVQFPAPRRRGDDDASGDAAGDEAGEVMDEGADDEGADDEGAEVEGGVIDEEPVSAEDEQDEEADILEDD